MELAFNVQGEFITNLARSQLYEEKRPFKLVQELLLSCMCGTNIPIVTLNKYVDDILTYKKKFTGNTKDNTFCLVDELNPIIPNILKNKNIEDYYLKLKQGKKNNFDNNDEYGFITPEGKFISVPWCEHSKWAREYIEENYSIKERLTNNPKSYVNSDFLVYVKGWLLLHNPIQDTARLEQGRAMTKAQKETLYDYYMHFNRITEANKLYEEE